jgi:hypothetical protein
MIHSAFPHLLICKLIIMNNKIHVTFKPFSDLKTKGSSKGQNQFEKVYLECLKPV